MINWSNFNGFFSTGVPPKVLYPSLVVFIALIVAGTFCEKVRNKWRYALFILLIEYLFVVTCSTIICRGQQSFEFDRVELIPFWTYLSIITHTPGVSVWDIVLNIVLFLPFGILVKLLYPSMSALKMLGVVVLCSLFVETNQYVFEKGVTQIDDMMLGFSIDYNRWPAMRIIKNQMLEKLTDEEIRSLSGFFRSNKDLLKSLEDSLGTSLKRSLRLAAGLV